MHEIGVKMPNVQQVPINPITLYDSSGNPILSTSGQLQTRLYDANGAGIFIGSDSDGQSVANQLGVISRASKFNGSTWDRSRTTEYGLLLASAARTASLTTSDVTNYNARGAHVMLYLTAVPAVPGSGGLKVQIVERNTQVGATFSLLLPSPASPLTSTGIYIFEVYPGVVTSDFTAQGNHGLPRNWYVNMIHADAQAYTYSLGYAHLM